MKKWLFAFVASLWIFCGSASAEESNLIELPSEEYRFTDVPSDKIWRIQLSTFVKEEEVRIHLRDAEGQSIETLIGIAKGKVITVNPPEGGYDLGSNYTLEIPRSSGLSTLFSKYLELDIKIHFSTEPLPLSEQVQVRVNQLQTKWNELRPVNDGEDATGYSLEVPYKQGRATDRALQDALNVTNFVRYTAGLNDNITLNETYNEAAQAASLVNYLNSGLSHSPTQPAGLDKSIYDLGFLGASKSNLGMGYSSLADSVINVRNGYLGDSDDSNISRVGHRRWVLSPALNQIGFGYIPGNKTWSSTAMYVIEGNKKAPNYGEILWPVETAMPLQLFNEDHPWSISFDPMEYSAQNIGELVVKLTKNNETITLTDNNTKHFYVDRGNYGDQKQVLIFRPDDMQPIKAGDHFTVEVSGLYTANNSPTTFTYETTFFRLK